MLVIKYFIRCLMLIRYFMDKEMNKKRKKKKNKNLHQREVESFGPL